MSSVILVSSDEEDEAPTKKPRLIRSIPATITPIKTTTPPNVGGAKTPKNRTLPSGITVTSRQSPATITSTTQKAADSGGPSAVVLRNLLSPTIERQTPSPPILQSSTVRRRKTPTPPQRTTPTPAGENRSSASPTSVVVPLITTVQSMTASTTPPLQLLATPPPQSSSTSFADQLMINPHLMHTSLPESTTITLHSPTNSNHQHYPPHNNNNAYKIQLPQLRANATPSPAVSPNSQAPSPASPLRPFGAAAAETAVRRIKPTTLLRNNDEAWQQRQQQDRPALISLLEDEPLSMAAVTPLPKFSAITLRSAPNNSLNSSSTSNVSSCGTTPPRSSATTNSSAAPVVLDLTETPDNLTAAVVMLDESPNTSASSVVLINGNAPSCSSSPPGGAVKLNGETPRAANSDNTVKQPNSPSLPVEPEYEQLISACRAADSSADMNKLIASKLLRYYQDENLREFVRSRGFRKNVRAVTERIQSAPHLVYYNLKTIVDELKVRRGKSKAPPAEPPSTTGPRVPGVDVDVNIAASSNGTAAVSGASTTTTGNKRTDEQIKKLNRALYILNKRIEKLEETEVDWEDDDSTYIQVERFKKRACQIYEKICDLTGENKNAHRQGKKPIQFTGTALPQFNRTLQTYINRTRKFPDFYDVLRMLEHCNREYSLGLVNFEMKRIAQDAFLKVGKLLQARRRSDLYETVTHFTANAKDPAAMDPELMAKLTENQRKRTKISDIINKYASLTAEEQREEARLQEAAAAQQRKDGTTEPSVSNAENTSALPTADPSAVVKDEESSSDDEEEDEDTLDDDVEKLTNGDSAIDNVDDLSDDDEEFITEFTANIETTGTTAETTASICDNSSKAVKNNNNNNNNNNLMRTKTGEAQPPPNGRLKEQPAAATAGLSNLKIVSIASLQRIETGFGKTATAPTATAKTTLSMAALSPTIRVGAAPTTPPSAPPPSAPPSPASMKQRTVAEIVISDEES